MINHLSGVLLSHHRGALQIYGLPEIAVFRVIADQVPLAGRT